MSDKPRTDALSERVNALWDENKPGQALDKAMDNHAELERENADLRAKLGDQREAMKDLADCKTAPDAEWLRGFAAQCIASIDAAIAKEGK